jgi:hypothetical protein
VWHRFRIHFGIEERTSVRKKETPMAVHVERLFFEEEQRFRQPWLWALMLGNALFLAAIFGTAAMQRPDQARDIAGAAALAFSLLGLVALLLYVARLSVCLDSQAIHIRFVPFFARHIPLEQIQCWEARTYRPIREYGGWGIRVGLFGRGSAYNVSGNRGVQLTFSDGKRLLIGSQRAEEFAAGIAEAKENAGNRSGE